MKIVRVAVADGKAWLYIDTMPDVPVVVSEGQEVYLSDEVDGHRFIETLWFEEPSAEKKLAIAKEQKPAP